MPKEFKIPDWKETIDTKSKKGKTILDKKEASSILPASLTKPGAKTTTIYGINSSISKTKKPKTNTKTEMAAMANFMAEALFSPTNF